MNKSGNASHRVRAWVLFRIHAQANDLEFSTKVQTRIDGEIYDAASNQFLDTFEMPCAEYPAPADCLESPVCITEVVGDRARDIAAGLGEVLARKAGALLAPQARPAPRRGGAQRRRAGRRLTRARMRTIEDMLTCKDTRPLARVLFRINPPLLDVINAGKPGQPALLSGPAVLLYNWSLFFGCSVKLILLAASFGDIDLRPVVFVVYLVLIVFIMVIGALAVTQPLRAIAHNIHRCKRPRPHRAWACVATALAAAAFAGAIGLT